MSSADLRPQQAEYREELGRCRIAQARWDDAAAELALGKALELLVTNRKQVRDLINGILEIIYGVEYTRGSVASTNLEPYSLNDGDDLILQFDDGASVPVVFTADQFQNINTAMTEGASRPRARENFKEGDSVRVIEGPFANFTGVVVEAKSEKQKLRVNLSIFGRATPVELDFTQVEKV